MSKRLTFKLVDTSLNNKVIGEVSFRNEKFYFKLDAGIQPDQWKKIGIIPYEPQEKAKSPSISYFIISRLPLRLRRAPLKQQFDYILANGLRVASDPYALLPA